MKKHDEMTLKIAEIVFENKDDLISYDTQGSRITAPFSG